MTRDECLEGHKAAEKLKIDINKKMIDMAREKNKPHHILEAIAVQEKSKASDQFYNEFGYELNDL